MNKIFFGGARSQDGKRGSWGKPLLPQPLTWEVVQPGWGQPDIRQPARDFVWGYLQSLLSQVEPVLYTEKGFRLLADLADEDLDGWKREVVLMQVKTLVCPSYLVSMFLCLWGLNFVGCDLKRQKSHPSFLPQYLVRSQFFSYFGHSGK